jgi:hypothetical protein
MGSPTVNPIEKEFVSESHDGDKEPRLRRVDTLKDDPRWLLTLRIVSSSGFSKAPRLRSFLQWVVRLALTGRSDQINEQSIGVAIFDRATGYDSNGDNIVRSHASRLRQKLDTYFQTDGINEPTWIDIPKGAYVPTFFPSPSPSKVNDLDDDPVSPVTEPQFAVESARSSATDDEGGQANSHGLIPSHLTQFSPQKRQMLFGACVAIVVALSFLAGYRYHRQHAGTYEANHALWQEMLGEPGHTLIIGGDSSLVLYQNFTGKTFSLGDYIAESYLKDAPQQSSTEQKMLYTIAHRRLTSAADLDISNRIGKRSEAGKSPAAIRFARDVRVDDLKGNNVILIGCKEANPWVQLYADSLNFNIVPNQQTKVFTVQNRSPKPGEAPEYHSVPGDPQGRAYAVVALLTNPDGSGHTLIIEGTGMAGTEAGADYVLDHHELSSLLHVKSSNQATVPDFEILLETSNLSGNAPKARLVALRVHGS